MSFTVSAKALSFAQAAIELYEGGMLRLADLCNCPIWTRTQVTSKFLSCRNKKYGRVAASGIVDELRVEVEEPRRRPARDEEGKEERKRQAAEIAQACASSAPSAEVQRRARFLEARSAQV